jgi:hypothetical protein
LRVFGEIPEKFLFRQFETPEKPPPGPR